MKRLVGIGVVALLTACGAGGTTLVASHGVWPGGPSLKAAAHAREHVALGKAEQLLRRVAVPAGAVRLPGAPAGNQYLDQQELGVSVVTMTAIASAFWRVHEPVASVIAFAEKHPTSGLSSAGGGGTPSGEQSVEFYGHGHGAGQRMVSVTAVGGGGWTYVRIDAGTPWIYPRPPGEAVPGATREIDIRDESVSRRVTDSGQVTQIVRWFDELDVSPPGAYVLCGAILQSRTTLVFRSASGARLASAVVPSGPANGCNPISFSIGGKRQWALVDTTSPHDAFVERVERLLALSLPKR